MSFLKKILPTASIKKTLNNIGSNTYESTVKTLAKTTKPAERITKFGQLKEAMKGVAKSGSSSLDTEQALKLNKHLGLDNIKDLTDKNLASFVTDVAEDLGDVEKYFSSRSANIIKKQGKYKTSSGASSISKEADKIFSDKASLVDKAKATMNKDNLGTFFKGSDLEGGAKNNKAIMAGRYGITAGAVTGSVDGVQMLSGDRTLTTENGKRNIPIIPFI